MRKRLRSDLAKAEGATAEEVNAPAVTVRPDDTLARAARLMAAHHVERLPVVDTEDRLRGIVSRGDLSRVFLRSDEDIEEEVRVVRWCPPCSPGTPTPSTSPCGTASSSSAGPFTTPRSSGSWSAS